MALIQLAAGAELDIATGAELRDQAKRLASLIDRGPARPNYLPMAATVIGTGGIATIVWGAPPAGRVWNVVSVTLVGPNDHGTITSPAGFVAMYFGDPFNPSLANVQHVKIALPSTVYPASDALWCPAGQQVFFQSDLALNAPETMTVTGMVAEYRTRDTQMTSGAP